MNSEIIFLALLMATCAAEIIKYGWIANYHILYVQQFRVMVAVVVIGACTFHPTNQFFRKRISVDFIVL